MHVMPVNKTSHYSAVTRYKIFLEGQNLRMDGVGWQAAGRRGISSARHVATERHGTDIKAGWVWGCE